MKIVTRKELLKMQGMFAYSEYEKGEFGESVYIKYSSEGDLERNNWTEEVFPILCVDMGEGNYYNNVDAFEKQPYGKEFPLSDFETQGNGFYEPMDKLYVVYSKEDVKGWINKLNELL
jgi:hypothetical protein